MKELFVEIVKSLKEVIKIVFREVGLWVMSQKK